MGMHSFGFDSIWCKSWSERKEAYRERADMVSKVLCLGLVGVSVMLSGDACGICLIELVRQWIDFFIHLCHSLGFNILFPLSSCWKFLCHEPIPALGFQPWMFGVSSSIFTEQMKIFADCVSICLSISRSTLFQGVKEALQCRKCWALFE